MQGLKDPFYDNITFEYMMAGDGNGRIYLSDVARYFKLSITEASKLLPKIQELKNKLCQISK